MRGISRAYSALTLSTSIPLCHLFLSLPLNFFQSYVVLSVSLSFTSPTTYGLQGTFRERGEGEKKKKEERGGGVVNVG